ncbi:MAG TPA: type II secretion system F family protein [Candidatus Saccharimonadales bacterium]|nr:type II secretion system F family protein [Candidatus Saccharimonadales bacterium]
MKFSYKAVDRSGAMVSGSAEAASKQALLGMLHRQGVQPVIIEVDKGKGWLGSLFGPKKKVKLNDLVVFTRQLSTMISAGVPLARSLSALQGDATNPYMREVLAGITKDVESGMPLGDAFAKYPNVFSDVYVNMVRAGEEGGILDKILKRLATQVEMDASIRKKILSAMMYPTVILSITVIAFFGIMLFIVPKLKVIMVSLGGPNAQLPVYTRVLLSFSDFCSRPTILGHTHLPVIEKIPNLVLFVILAAIGAVYLIRYIRTPSGQYKFHALLLRLPVVKIIVLKIAIARFARTFASLMGAGVSVLDSLDVTAAALGNKVIESELRAAAEEVKNGKPLSQPLSHSKHFPPIVSQMLLVGEETGQIDGVLVKIADFYEEEVTVMIDGLAAIIEPIMIIILGAGVGLIAASVMGPIANLSKNVGN